MRWPYFNKTWNAYKKMKMGKMSRAFVVGQQ